MSVICLLGACAMFILTAYCISENALILSFLLAFGACEMTYHAAGFTGKHYTSTQIEQIRREAVEQYKNGVNK